MLRIVTKLKSVEINNKNLTLYICKHKDRIYIMAYLTFTSSEENNSCFKFIGTSSTQSTGLISSNTSLISNNTSLISDSTDGGFDVCSFYSGPSDSAIISFGESAESCGSIAYSSGAESCGSIAYSGGAESCGSIASSSSSFSGGGCNYCC